MKKDIHKVDNILVTGGYTLLVIMVVGGSCSGMFQTGPTELGPAALWLCAPVAMLAAGYAIRSRENRIVALWGILENATRVRVSDIEQNTGFGRPFIRRALALINQQGQGFYVWDEKTDTIADARLQDRYLVLERCDSCGAGIHQQVALDFGELPECPYCGSPAQAEALNRLKRDALRDLRAPRDTPSPFSPWVFIVLLIVFWPAAVVYAIWKSGVFLTREATTP